MTSDTIERPHPHPLHTFAAPDFGVSALRRMVATMRKRARTRRDYERLLNGPDYLLHDIGINRADLYDHLNGRR